MNLHVSPLVAGDTVTWPSDGWYQVQDATDYSQICAGVQSCTVERGAYIVINHTTEQRFEPVIVVAEVPVLQEHAMLNQPVGRSFSQGAAQPLGCSTNI